MTGLARGSLCGFFLLLLTACPAPADCVELKSGARFFGTIVEESDQRVTLSTRDGTVTFRREQIHTMTRDRKPGDRKPDPKPAGASGGGIVPATQAGAAADPDPATLRADALPQGPLPDLVVRVGPGGVTRADFELQLARIARDLGARPLALSGEARSLAMRAAIEEELLFQAALADGVVRDPRLRERILAAHRESRMTSRPDPASFALAEVRAYYDDHRSQFSASFAESETAVRERLADARSAERSHEAGADPTEQDSGAEAEEPRLRSALASGVAREAGLHRRIAEAWLEKHAKERTDVLPALYQRFRVEVLMRE